MAVVQWDASVFRATFPGKFDAPMYTDAELEACFNRACLQLDNSETSIIRMPARVMILNLATAHIATLNKRDPNLQGRINSATQGSVSVGSTVASTTFSVEWWGLTEYGQECWSSLKAYRSFFFVSGCR